MGEHNARLTSGVKPVYQRDGGSSLFPAADQWADAFLSLKTNYAFHKKNTKTKKRRSIGQQPGTKSARGPADKPLDNRWLCSPIRFT